MYPNLDWIKTKLSVKSIIKMRSDQNIDFASNNFVFWEVVIQIDIISARFLYKFEINRPIGSAGIGITMSIFGLFFSEKLSSFKKSLEGERSKLSRIWFDFGGGGGWRQVNVAITSPISMSDHGLFLTSKRRQSTDIDTSS